jgi:hypothetical protein
MARTQQPPTEGQPLRRKTVDYESDEAVPEELNIPGDVLFALMDKVREYQAKVAVVEPDPGSNASDDKMMGVLEDYKDDPVEIELRRAITDMNVDQRADLIALMWLGRGDFDVSEWGRRRQEAAALDRADIPGYLIKTPLLADYLNEGLAALHRSVLEENPPAPL